MYSSRVTKVVAAFLSVGLACAVPAQFTGPSTSSSAYMLPVMPGALTRSILTVGESVNLKPDGTPYRLCGKVDGMGIYPTGRSTFELLVNHEFSSGEGIVRAHGRNSSFVSRWTIARNLNMPFVYNGRDQIKTTNMQGGSQTIFRLCSADMPSKSSLYNVQTGKGTQQRFFMDGEENGVDGRIFAIGVGGSMDGVCTALPYLGKCSHENEVASPHSGDKTIVLTTDDVGSGGELYVYMGDKRLVGTEVEKAGFVGGKLYGIRVPGNPLENRTTGFTTNTFELVDLGDASTQTGSQIQTASTLNAITGWLKPEDCLWDRYRPGIAYVVTSDRFNSTGSPGRTRVWKLTFNSVTNPTGGTVEMLLDGTEGCQMLDNIEEDMLGNLLLQEDTGGLSHQVRVWHYDMATDQLTVVAQSDPARFATGGASFLTINEETSGIVSAAEVMGPGWFLITLQAHYDLDVELDEGGQIMALYCPLSVPAGFNRAVP